MNQHDYIQENKKYDYIQENKKELFFILEYSNPNQCNVNLKVEKSFLKIKYKDSNIIEPKYSGSIENIVKYDVFQITLEPNEKEQDLIFEYESKNYIINLKSYSDPITFIFDMEIKEFEYNKIKQKNLTGKIYPNKINKLDKLIIFKRIAKELECEEILIKQSLLHYKENNFHYLLNMFCISDIPNISIVIINHFYSKTQIGSPSSLEDEEKDIIKNHMKRVENELDKYMNLDSLSKEKFYSFLIYYKILYTKNEINSFIEKLFNDEDKKKILLGILKEYNKILSTKLYLKLDIIEDLIKNYVNEYETLKIILKYVYDIECYLKIINDNINKIYEFPNFKEPIKIDNNFRKGRNEIEKICEYIENINNFQLKKSQRFVDFDIEFWNIYTKDQELKRPNKINIQKLLSLFKCLNQYLRLNQINSEKSNIICFDDYKKNDTSDSFAQILNNIITKMIKNEGEEKLENKEKIDFLLNCNPYYMDENYNDKRDPNIFKEIDIFDEDILKQLIKVNNLFIKSTKYKDFLTIVFEKVDDFMKFKKLFILLDNKKECELIYNKMYEKLEELLSKNKLSKQEDITQMSDIILSFINLIIKTKYKSKAREILENISKNGDKNFEEIIFIKIFKEYNEIDDIKKYIIDWAIVRVKNIYERIDSFDNNINLVKLLQSLDLKIFF